MKIALHCLAVSIVFLGSILAQDIRCLSVGYSGVDPAREVWEIVFNGAENTVVDADNARPLSEFNLKKLEGHSTVDGAMPVQLLFVFPDEKDSYKFSEFFLDIIRVANRCGLKYLVAIKLNGALQYVFIRTSKIPPDESVASINADGTLTWQGASMTVGQFSAQQAVADGRPSFTSLIVNVDSDLLKSPYGIEQLVEVLKFLNRTNNEGAFKFLYSLNFVRD